MIFPSPNYIVNFDVSKGKFEPLGVVRRYGRFPLRCPLAKEKVPRMCFTRYSYNRTWPRPKTN